MRYRYCFLISIVSAGAACGQILFAQNEIGVIFLNAADEHASCMAAYDDAVKGACGGSAGVRVGRTIRLVVQNRHFLTNYSLEIGEAPVPLPSASMGGPVKMITLPSADSFANSSCKAIERKTARDFLGQLLDVTSSFEAADEIDREDQVLRGQADGIRRQIDEFNRDYSRVVSGDGSPNLCEGSKRKRTGAWVSTCLDAELTAAEPPISGNSPPDEPAFRILVSSTDRLFADAEDFGTELTEAGLTSQAHAIESSLSCHKSDLQTFQANLRAAQDADWVLEAFKERKSELVSLEMRSELRKRLRDTRGGQVGAKPSLDEAEINEQIDRYFALLRIPGSIPAYWQGELEGKIDRLLKPNADGDPLDAEVVAIHTKIDTDLVNLIGRINDRQVQLSARINEIFQASAIPVTESDAALNGITANGVVSYRIARIREFEPYVLANTGNPPHPLGAEEVSRGAFAVTDTSSTKPKRTVWEILRLAH